MKLAGNIINEEFKAKIKYILHDINTYMNVIFNFLYINRLFYTNLYFLSNNTYYVANSFNRKLKILISSLLPQIKAGWLI